MLALNSRRSEAPRCPRGLAHYRLADYLVGCSTLPWAAIPMEDLHLLAHRSEEPEGFRSIRRMAENLYRGCPRSPSPRPEP